MKQNPLFSVSEAPHKCQVICFLKSQFNNFSYLSLQHEMGEFCLYLWNNTFPFSEAYTSVLIQYV